MSDVQLSTTLERVAASRTFPHHARTGVCRNLFGPVDHDELNREMKSKLLEILDRDRRRWNFDFQTDTPLEGDYGWEESKVDTVPDFYRDSVQIGRVRITVPVRARTSLDTNSARDCPRDVPAACPALGSRLSCLEGTASSGETNQENRADHLNLGRAASCRTVLCCRRKRASAVVTANPAITHITDFYPKKKKMSEAKQQPESDSQPSSVIPTEQTPRKRIR
ncbi:cyclin-dependent kinase inhibitor 1B-like [Lepisosteus oculatus]|uniref:cyclin-dependent kinase inhibitor 1B-like n=1 Tax=Lepisosteus oculatus TaxID=7918 RepID=UPI0035F512A4